MKTTIDENGNVTITSEIREAFVNSELVLMGITLGKIGGTWVGSRVERSGNEREICHIEVLGKVAAW